MIMKRILCLLLVIGFYVNPVQATVSEETFKSPDIKNDYCGAAIDFRFCKCGFHGEKTYCDQIGQTESTPESRQ